MHLFLLSPSQKRNTMHFELSEEHKSVQQAAREFAQNVLKPGVIERDELQKFPTEEKYGLTSDIRRAANSVCHNLAEGYGRFENKNKSRFYVWFRYKR